MNKKIFLISILAVLLLTGCGKKSQKIENNDDTTASQINLTDEASTEDLSTLSDAGKTSATEETTEYKTEKTTEKTTE